MSVRARMKPLEVKPQQPQQLKQIFSQIHAVNSRTLQKCALCCECYYYLIIIIIIINVVLVYYCSLFLEGAINFAQNPISLYINHH